MFFIGARIWPGITKLVEEAGEVVQVCGKLMANGGASVHYDGSNLYERLEEELGDVLAAIDFVMQHNDLRLSRTRIESRRKKKLQMFEHWHEDTLKRTPEPTNPRSA